MSTCILAANGSGSDFLSTKYYYDRNGQVVAIEPEHGAATEIAFDGADRAYQTRSVLSLELTHFGFRLHPGRWTRGFSISFRPIRWIKGVRVNGGEDSL